MEREIPYATGVMPLKTMKIKYSTLLICPTLKLLLFLLVKGRELALNGLNIGHFSFNGMTGETRIYVSVSMERFGLCFSNTVSILAKMDLILCNSALSATVQQCNSALSNVQQCLKQWQ